MAKKQQKKNNTQAIVVYKPQPASSGKKKKHKKKLKIGSIPASVRGDSNCKRYWAALTDPFSEAAIGARVVDQYSCHTTTYCLRATHTITAGSSSSIGCWVFPSLVGSMVVPNGTFAGSTTITWLDGTTTGNIYTWGFDTATLASKLGAYRIVGMGVRTTNMSSMTNSSGKFIMGSYPMSSQFVTRIAGNNVGGALPAVVAAATRDYTLGTWGVPMASGVCDYASLVNYPGTVVKSALEMAEHEIDIVPRPCDPKAFAFRQPNDGTMGTNYGGAGTIADSTYLDLNGFEACFIGATGLVASTSSIDVEIVYHIEGPPVITAGTPASVFVNAHGSQSPTNFNGFFAAVESALKLPAVRDAAHVGADLLHPALGRLARALL